MMRSNRSRRRSNPAAPRASESDTNHTVKNWHNRPFSSYHYNYESPTSVPLLLLLLIPSLLLSCSPRRLLVWLPPSLLWWR